MKKGWFEHWNDPYWKYINAINILDKLDQNKVQESQYNYKTASQPKKFTKKTYLNAEVMDEFEH